MPTFFFVNKTPASCHLTRGEALETTAIQHFVQKGRKRARKAKLTSAFKACPLPIDAASKPVPSNDGEKDLEILQKHCFNAQPEASRSPQQIQRDNVVSITTARTLTPSLSRNVSSATDPFQVTTIPIDDCIRSLINYYTTVYHPTLWPNETIALRRGGYIFENAVNHVVQSSLQDSLAMYCLLTASVSRMRHVDQMPLPGATSSRENQYMSQALHLMQERINQAAEHQGTNLLYLLTSMVFLSAAEAYRDNPSASKTHLKACVSLLDYHKMGVMDVANPNLQGQLLMSDLFIGCVKLEACLFIADEYDPGSLEAVNIQPHELDPLQYELTLMATSLSQNDNISFEVRSLISQICETYSTKRCLNTTTMTPTRAMQTTHWITKRSMAIRNRLLSVFSHSQPEADTTSAEELLEKALRIALIQFTLLSMNITGRIKTVKIMSRHLQRVLGPLLRLSTTTNQEDELFLWLVIIGYSCAQDRTENEEWFAEKCRELIDRCEAPRNPSWDGEGDILARLEQIQYRYFYHEHVQRPRLRKLIDETFALSASPERLGDGILAQTILPSR